MIDEKKIENLFTSLGCMKKELQNGEICYVGGDVHFKFTYATEMDFYVLETAEDSNEASKNIFEDDEIYSAKTDDELIIENLKNDLIKHYDLM